MSEDRSRILNLLAEGKISVDEAERLLDALTPGATATGDDGTEAAASAASGGGSAAGALPKFMYVKVDSTSGDNVNIKIPLNLVRSGLKLTSLIPPQAMEQINDSMGEHGMSFDLNNLKPEDIEELVTALREMEVNVDAKNGDNVRVYCA